MYVDLRPTRKLRESAAARSALGPIMEAVCAPPSLTGEILRPLIEGHGDVRMHVSNGALGSFTGTLPLLHPFGRIQCHDLFVTAGQQYRTGFYGPGKYDGSVVNWVNGPLLQLVASRRGFGVEFTPFRQRPGSNITTLTAQAVHPPAHPKDDMHRPGVIDVKSAEVEQAELVASRIRRALEYVPADRLMINPDCGLRHLAPEVARQKLRAMVAGVALVRAELGGPVAGRTSLF